MMTDYDTSYIDLVNERFSYIDELPIPATVLDMEEAMVVKYNGYFAQMAGLYESVPFAMEEDFLSGLDLTRLMGASENYDEINSSKKIHFKTEYGYTLLLHTNIRFVMNLGKVFAVCTYTNVGRYRQDDAPEAAEQVTEKNFLSFTENMFDKMLMFICVADALSKEIIYMNNEARGRIGNVVGQFITAISDFNWIMNPIGEASGLSEVLTHEVELERRWLRVYNYNTYWAGGRVVNVYVADDITDEKINRELMEKYKRSFDELTGAYDKNFGLDELRNIITDVQETKDVASVCYIDLQDVRKINHQFGHEAGDTYLKNFVAIFKRTIRQTDIIARLGSDKFLVILPKCRIPVVTKIMNNVKQRFVEARDEYAASFIYDVYEIEPDKKIDMYQVLEELSESIDKIKELYRTEKAAE